MAASRFQMRWIVCIAISLAVHMALLLQSAAGPTWHTASVGFDRRVEVRIVPTLAETISAPLDSSHYAAAAPSKAAPKESAHPVTPPTTIETAAPIAFEE